MRFYWTLCEPHHELISEGCSSLYPTREVLGTVGVTFLVIVLVMGGKRQTRGGVSGQGALEVTESATLLNLEGIFGFLSAQLERETDGCKVIHPVRELDVEDVAAIFGNRVNLL